MQNEAQNELAVGGTHAEDNFEGSLLVNGLNGNTVYIQQKRLFGKGLKERRWDSLLLIRRRNVES